MINNIIKVSVIVPVYNPGSYFRHCIDSLLNQTLKDIEIIFVDDCSTDDSVRIIEEAAERDDRITLIKSNENTGSGIARNKGIEIAKGEYLCFVDSDDYIADDFLELLYNKAHKNKLDLVKGTIIYVKKDGIKFKRDNDRNLNERIKSGLKENNPLFTLFLYEHQCCLYLRRFINKNMIRYGNSRRGHDVTYLLKACHKADKFDFEEDAEYYFLERDDSAMHKVDSIQLKNLLDSVIERFDYVITNIKDDRNTEKFTDIVIRTELRNVTYYTNSMESKEAKEYGEGLKEQLDRLPWKNKLTDKSFSYKVLDKYGYALPESPFVLPWQTFHDPFAHIELTKLWINFFKEHPEEYGNGESLLFNIIYKTIVFCFSLNKDIDTIDRKEALRQLWKQVKRLNFIQLCRLSLYVISRKIKSVLRQYKK